MRWIIAAAAVLSAAAVVPAAHADSYFDLEHARANARAGGPVSEYDAELLDRWGALSGTRDWRARAPRAYRETTPPARKAYRYKAPRRSTD